VCRVIVCIGYRLEELLMVLTSGNREREVVAADRMDDDMEFRVAECCSPPLLIWTLTASLRLSPAASRAALSPSARTSLIGFRV